MFGQKRAHSPDAHDDNNFRQGHPHPHFGRGVHHGGHPFQSHQQQFGGHHQFNKRHRGDHYQQPQSLEDKIARLGEIGARNSDIGTLANEIETELKMGMMNELRIQQIVVKICKSCVSFPTRVGTYTTLIGLISAKNFAVGRQIIQTLHASYPIYLEAQRWQEALTIMHILSSLVYCNVIDSKALFSQFKSLMETTIEENVPQSRTDYYIYTILSSIPFVAERLNEDEIGEKGEEMEIDKDVKVSTMSKIFNDLLSDIEDYLSKRSKEHLNSTRVWMSDDYTMQMDYLDSLWVQMKNFRANNWIETHLSRPYNEKDCRDTMKSNLVPADLPTLEIPAHSDRYIYPSPRIIFRIFEDDVVEHQKHIPGSDKIERFCFENSIRNIIDENSTDPKGCARHLTHMCKWDHVPLKHLLVETILGELFTLPKPKHDEILYHVLLHEFTKIFHASNNPEGLKNNYDVVLSDAVRVSYENLDTMSVTCFTRFVNWFSFHLNNTEFLYPWQTWSDATTKEENSPKATFVRDILDRCIRLSFRKKIETLVQNHLTALIPPEVAINYQPVFADHPRAAELASTVRELIAFKKDGVEICQKLNIKIDSVNLPEDFILRDEKLADQLLKIDIFTAVTLDMAKKSLTHISSAIGKFKNVLKALTKVPQGQNQLLQTINSCLSLHPQLQVILVDKLLKADLVESHEVCKWVFSESMKPYHTKSHVWEILNNTLTRSNQSIDKLVEQKAKLQSEIDMKKKVKVKKENDGSGTPNADDEDNPENGANLNETNNGEDVEMEDREIADDQRKQELREELEKLDLNIDLARDAHKELILQVFTMFAMVLGDHIRGCESEGKSFMDCIYRWLTGRMQEVFYIHFDTTCGYTEEIRTAVDGTPSIGRVIFNLNQ